MSSIEPRVVVETGRLDANIRRFHAATPVAVRAHVKGHRTPRITARQLNAGAVGIAVQFAREARAHLAAGARDVVVAWPWPDEWRWAGFAALAADCRVAVHVTSADAVRGLAAAATAAGTELGLRIQLDDGTGRGVDADAALALARLAAGTPGVRLDGLTGYVALTSGEQVKDAAAHGRRAAAALVEVAAAIRADGHECPVVCAGGTPSAAGAAAVPGVTEICAGAYPLLDAGLAAAGRCDVDDVALWIEADAAAADELLDRCHQPWAPGVVRVEHRGRLVPAHTCPLLPRVAELSVRDGDRPAGTWPVRCDRDRRDAPDVVAR